MSSQQIPYMAIAPLRDAMKEYSKSYDNWGSDYSVTQLIRPPRIVQLEGRHKAYFDNVPFTEDTLTKQLKSFKGTAIHSWFEIMLWKYISTHPNSGYMQEKRIWDRICDRKISGKFDCFRNGALYDWKTTSVWKRIFGQLDDYEKQLNLYAYLLGTCGTKVTALFIIAWYMDWDKFKIYKKDYPPKEIEQIHISNLWKPSEQKGYLYDLIEGQKRNETLADDQLDKCKPEDMWEKDTQYAVTYPTANRAVRVLNTMDEAKTFIIDAKAKAKLETTKAVPTNLEDYYVETRGGDRTRCSEYCKANCFCNQYAGYCKRTGREVLKPDEAISQEKAVG